MNRLKNPTFNDQQQNTVIRSVYPVYRSVFSLNQEGLEICTTAEAEFPLHKNSKPVDRNSYRTNPRAQEVIDKCVEDIQSVGIVEKNPSA